jgi:ABC-2 type transport system permease protein
VTAACRSYVLLLRWQLLRQRAFLPLLVTIQVALGVGVIYGFSFLVPRVTPTTALFFATGAPTLSIILIGLTVVPQETAQSRTDGRLSYIATLPVPRLTPMLAEVSFWLLVQLPGTVITLALAALHFDVHLRISPFIVAAVGLVALTSAAVGYALAVLMPPTVAAQIASFLSIALLLFSTINFPLDRLPVALQDVHRALPVTYMADIVRGSLSGTYDASKALAFGVVSAYCVVGLALAARAASRRR